MKKYLYPGLILILVLFTNCSNDDDGTTTFAPESIGFLNSDNIQIGEKDCIDPDGQYSVVINVSKVGRGPYEATKVEYTVNGESYSTTFTKNERKSIPVILKEGANIAEFVSNGVSSTVYITAQDDFVLVK